VRCGDLRAAVLTVARDGEPVPFERTPVKKMRTRFEAARFLGYRALVYREKGDREAALKDAEQCLALDPENVYGLQAMGALDLDAGKYDQAIGRLANLKDLAFPRLLEATAYARKGDPAKAAAIYAEISESDLSERAAMRQNAKAALLQALQGYAQASLDQARAAESAGRLTEALDGYAAALRLADEATASLIHQRVAILLQAQPSLAELPEEARKFALRGDVLIKDGAFAQALAEYRSALKIAPLNPQLHFNRALIHGQLKDYRAAIGAMTVYLQLSPNAANARAAKDEIYKWEFQLEKEGKK
jgi:tetratricopeptide (TPR) repeat protein